MPVVSPVLKQINISLRNMGYVRPPIGLLMESLLVPHARVLECLALHRAFKPYQRHEQGKQVSRVMLERLATLDFEGSLEEAAQFFTYVDLPYHVGFVRLLVC